MSKACGGSGVGGILVEGQMWGSWVEFCGSWNMGREGYCGDGWMVVRMGGVCVCVGGVLWGWL